MAMTMSALWFMGALAAGTGWLGLFREFDDHWTPVLLTFLSAITWALFGLSAYDVIVLDTAVASASEPIMPLVLLGLGLAFITALFGLYDLVTGLSREASDVSPRGLEP